MHSKCGIHPNKAQIGAGGVKGISNRTKNPAPLQSGIRWLGIVCVMHRALQDLHSFIKVLAEKKTLCPALLRE